MYRRWKDIKERKVYFVHMARATTVACTISDNDSFSMDPLGIIGS